MFGNGKTEGPARRGGALSVIGADVGVKGDVTTTSDLHIDGTIEGDIDCGALVQGAASRITGIVKAQSARLAGTIEGSVAVVALTIERTARISGDVSYETLAIDAGARIDGQMKHRGQDAAPAPQLKLAAASDADD